MLAVTYPTKAMNGPGESVGSVCFTGLGCWRHRSITTFTPQLLQTPVVFVRQSAPLIRDTMSAEEINFKSLYIASPPLLLSYNFLSTRWLQFLFVLSTHSFHDIETLPISNNSYIYITSLNNKQIKQQN